MNNATEHPDGPSDAGPTLEQYVADRERISALERLELAITPKTPPACPDWCAEEPGHDYDSTDYDAALFSDLSASVAAGQLLVFRYHRTYFRDVERETVSVFQVEQAAVGTDTEPIVTLEPAEMRAEMSFDDWLTPRGARKVADALIAAAAVVERANG